VTLPAGWVAATVAEIADTRLGKMLDAAKNKGDAVPYLRNVNVRWGDFDLSDLFDMRVTPEEYDELAVQNGDLFVCEGGEPGRSAVWRAGPRRIVFQKALHRIRPLGGVEPDYLARHLRYAANSNALSGLLTGTTIKHLPQVGLQRIKLGVPPVAEQRRIVAKLDALTARLARARAELDRVSVLASHLRGAALTSASAMLVADQAAPIASIAVTMFDGPFGSNLKSADYTTEGARVVRLENIGHLGFIGDKRTYISLDKYAGLTRHTLQAQDVLFSSFVDKEVRVCRFPEGVEEPTINKADCFVVRVDPLKCDAAFLTYMLAAPATYEAMKGAVHGATRPRIGLSQLKNYQINVPPLETQKAIVAKLDAAFARADRLEAEAARARSLIDRLESAILAKAFRGELVPQDPNDEPACVLLDRIRAERAAAPKAKRGRSAKASA
jgi:type I restriction enzyme S subunit